MPHFGACAFINSCKIVCAFAPKLETQSQLLQYVFSRSLAKSHSDNGTSWLTNGYFVYCIFEVLIKITFEAKSALKCSNSIKIRLETKNKIKMKLKPGLLLLLFLLYIDCKCYGREILLLISCPQHRAHSCQSLRENLRQQQQQISKLKAIPTDYDYAIKVHIMHELFNYWNLLDALPHLRSQTRLLNANTDWIIWCQHNTHVASCEVSSTS